MSTPAPQAPQAPHPQIEAPTFHGPRFRIGKQGSIPKGRSGSPAPRAPRGPLAGAERRDQQRKQAQAQRPPAQIIHIHQDKPPVVQPSEPTEKKPSKAGEARDALRKVMGEQISKRTQGMPAEGHRLFQSHARAHGRRFVKEYHQAGMDRARELVKEAQQHNPGYKPREPKAAEAEPGNPAHMTADDIAMRDALDEEARQDPKVTPEDEARKAKLDATREANKQAAGGGFDASDLHFDPARHKENRLEASE